MNADGTGQTNVTNNPAHDVNPAWSPDGTKIAFDSFRDDPSSDIYAMSADGSGVTRLTNNAVYDAEPAWSPDGTKIAFESLRDEPSIETYTMNADGSAVTRLTDSAANEAFDGLPDWQPLPNHPPNCSGVRASPSVLRHFDHRLVSVALDGATDPDGDSVSLSIDGVTQDEPVTGPGDHTSPDAIDVGGGEVRLRAERKPRATGGSTGSLHRLGRRGRKLLRHRDRLCPPQEEEARRRLGPAELRLVHAVAAKAGRLNTAGDRRTAATRGPG